MEKASSNLLTDVEARRSAIVKMSAYRKRSGSRLAFLNKSVKHTGRGGCSSTYHSWPSRFLSIALFMLFGKAITITAQNDTSSAIYPPPLTISTHDITLKVGDRVVAVIEPTKNFVPVFQNTTAQSVALVFKASLPGVISPLDNITLVGPTAGNRTGPIDQNHTLDIVALEAGIITIVSEIIPAVNNYTPSNIFLRVDVYKLETLILLSNIVGWIYFVVWSVSFYPQIIQNYQRKSVRGLSLDFVFLNITGFAVYAVYNIGLFWVKSVQDEYLVEFPQGVIPVQLNDVVFTLHAVFACSVTVIQCLIYDRGSQTISDTGKMLLCTILVFIFVILVVAVSGAITWLTFLTWCSYVKLVITLIKYMPQAYLNWYRKSTSGWSIGNILLDFTGGIFSLTQMIFIAYNHNDWSSFFGDLTKFGLGLFSILFDIFFIIQHYVLYRNHAAYEPIEGGDNPDDANQYGEITTSNHHFAASAESNNQMDSGSSGGDNNFGYNTSYDKEHSSSAAQEIHHDTNDQDNIIVTIQEPKDTARGKE